jgi:CHAT domain-containing protein
VLAALHAQTALRLLELARSRALSDLMTADASGTGLPAELLESWRGAAAEVALRQDRLAAALAREPPDAVRQAAATAELVAAQQVYHRIEDQLREREPRFWQLAAPSPDRVDPSAVLAGLPPGHAVLMYSFDRPDLLACGLTREGMVAAHWSREERRIDHLADRLLTACAQGQPWNDLAAELAAILVQPLASALEGVETVHVIASGATLRVPFAVLPWQGRPLGRRFTLTTLPSLSAHPLLMPAGQSSAALVVGDPAGMVHSGPGGELLPLRDLPGAAVEAAAVARVLGTTPLIGADATETAVRAALLAAGVVHLATHGVLDPDSELASAVVLANGDELTVAELLGLRLRADLVVLSACQTGTGKPVGGDELLGLGRGLLAAGARSALVTQWPVDDVSAALVMAEFHSLRAAGMPTAQALRAATDRLSGLTPQQARDKYAALREGLLPNTSHHEQSGLRTISTAPPVTAAPYAHPLHWAPYVLIGA